jgi:hypothetical protein
MNAAFLFNSDVPKYNGSYGTPILNTVLGGHIVKESNRHMKISIGDVLTFGKPLHVFEKTYFTDMRSQLFELKLRATFNVATVYSLTFENMTYQIALELHEELKNDSAYLGWLEVNFKYGPHLNLFRNSMISKYRVQGKTCSIFYPMGEEDAKDLYEIEEIKELGYENVTWEDNGAHKTIFDNFDTLEHFKQIDDFKDAIADFLENHENDASELVMLLEDLNPRLFNVLGSVASAILSARHEEDVAQSALSGRRFLEKLANELFPASNTPHNGRLVGEQQYKNRLWAYAYDNIANLKQVQKIGKEIDTVIDELNAGVHGNREKHDLLQPLSKMTSLTAVLLMANPSKSRKPYEPFNNEMIQFIKESILNSKV